MIRKFTLFTEPHIADPTWLCPVIETTEDENGAQRSVMMSDVIILKRVIEGMERKLIEQNVRLAAEREILEVLGVSGDEFIAALRRRRVQSSKAETDGAL